jgi:hypothetical protein
MPKKTTFVGREAELGRFLGQGYVGTEGPRGLLHRLRGRPASHRLPADGRAVARSGASPGRLAHC